jgi:hypothetical protein
MSPKDDARWWLSAGLDKNGLEIQYINEYIGKG